MAFRCLRFVSQYGGCSRVQCFQVREGVSKRLSFCISHADHRAQGAGRRKRVRPTKKLYGLDREKTYDFGWQCLLARRFAERGVRFIQCTRSIEKVQ